MAGEAAGYAHSSELSEAAIKRAADTVKAVRAATAAPWPRRRPAPTGCSTPTTTRSAGALRDQGRAAGEIDAYARDKDSRVRQVMASLSGEWQAVQILRAGGQRAADIRPLVRLNVSVVVGEGERMESGSYGGGGRITYEP